MRTAQYHSAWPSSTLVMWVVFLDRKKKDHSWFPMSRKIISWKLKLLTQITLELAKTEIKLLSTLWWYFNFTDVLISSCYGILQTKAFFFSYFLQIKLVHSLLHLLSCTDSETIDALIKKYCIKTSWYLPFWIHEYYIPEQQLHFTLSSLPLQARDWSIFLEVEAIYGTKDLRSRRTLVIPFWVTA